MTPASPYATDVEFTPDGRFGYVFGDGETHDDGEIMFIDLADGSTSVVPVPAATESCRRRRRRRRRPTGSCALLLTVARGARHRVLRAPHVSVRP